MITFQPTQCTDEYINKYVDLFSVTFPHAKIFDFEYLKWLYKENPDGNVVGYDAILDNKVVAHYVCIPALIYNNGIVVKALLSLNTATHPEFQGKGLFTKLANYTYNSASNLGYDCVYGIANANSTPGFINKLGFQFVKPLLATIGIGTFYKNPSKFEANSNFYRIWTNKSLEWRTSSPANKIFLNTNNQSEFFASTMFGFICPVFANIDIKTNQKLATKKVLSPIKLFIGLVPANTNLNIYCLNIPRLFRPSPLNLIYKSLNDRVINIDENKIFLTFLDFDGY